MNFKHKINIFLENKKWLDKKIFKSKKSIDNFIYYLSQITINECFLQPKFKKFKNFGYIRSPLSKDVCHCQ